MLDKRVGASRQDRARPGSGSSAPRNQAGRPTLAELDRRKANVMEIATQLFVAQGFAETSLVDIAKRAGVATRTLYQHFGDKEAIFREVVYARPATSLMPSPIPSDDASLFDVLVAKADELTDYVLAERSIDLMRLMVAESRRFPDLIKKIANATFARLLKNMTEVFRTLAERGQIPDGDHAATASLFADLILGNRLLMVYTDWQPLVSTHADLELKVRLFIAGRFGDGEGAPQP